ncbi:MAG: hypothetical protein H0X29_08900, partial [Parachlamydiaceae bacterium]|nr:hypothetical protein [Parachlamydiaceae bacterium]
MTPTPAEPLGSKLDLSLILSQDRLRSDSTKKTSSKEEEIGKDFFALLSEQATTS